MKIVRVSKRKKAAATNALHHARFLKAHETESTSDRLARAQSYLDATREQFAINAARARQLLLVTEQGTLAGPASHSADSPERSQISPSL